MIQEAYVSFDIAKLLKEKGFNEATLTYYEVEDDEYATHFRDIPMTNNFPDEYPRETHQMVLVWLRNQGVHISISLPVLSEGYSYEIMYHKKIFAKYRFDTYEEATEEAIKYVLENLI